MDGLSRCCCVIRRHVGLTSSGTGVYNYYSWRSWRRLGLPAGEGGGGGYTRSLFLFFGFRFLCVKILLFRSGFILLRVGISISKISNPTFVLILIKRSYLFRHSYVTFRKFEVFY